MFHNDYNPRGGSTREVVMKRKKVVGEERWEKIVVMERFLVACKNKLDDKEIFLFGKRGIGAKDFTSHKFILKHNEG